MNRLLVIDTETGGLDPSQHSIFSLGVVLWENGEELDSVEVFVLEPEITYDPEALEVNKIDLQWLRSHGSSPKDAVSQLTSFLKKHAGLDKRREKIPLAGHNVYFDIGFLKRLCKLADFDYDEIFSHRVLDTAGIIRFLNLAGKLPLESASSNEAFRYFDIKLKDGERHTALGDAKATALLLNRLLELIKIV